MMWLTYGPTRSELLSDSADSQYLQNDGVGILSRITTEPRHEKTCLRGLRPVKT